MFDNNPSPIQEIKNPVFSESGVKVLVKRDDLLHELISGNKWRKLKYNLIWAKSEGYGKLLTFGGAYSNHLAAVAAAGRKYGFKTRGIVRGERTALTNATLDFAESCGMELYFVSREVFRRQSWTEIINAAGISDAGFYTLPMGGSNCLALTGCAGIVAETEIQLAGLPDYFCVACGTGATLAGIISGLKGRASAIGFPVLKGDFMQREASKFLTDCTNRGFGNWAINNDYHFGGFAKFNSSLISFINSFRDLHGIPLDPIYTGKLFFAVHDLIQKGYFERGSTIMLIHTGGLQGIAGFNERFNGILDS